MKKFDLIEIIRKSTLEPIGNIIRLMNENGRHIATVHFEEPNEEIEKVKQKSLHPTISQSKI